MVTGKLEDPRNVQSRFLVYVKDFLKSIEVKDIALFYSEEKVTYVITRNNERFYIARTLNQLEARVDARQFFRVNRMHLISYESIYKIEPYLGNRLLVFLKSPMDTKVVVSREKVSDFKNWLNH